MDLVRRFRERFSPGAIIFFFALALIGLGLLVPGLEIIAGVGGIIIGIFILIWVVWIIFFVNKY